MRQGGARGPQNLSREGIYGHKKIPEPIEGTEKVLHLKRQP